MSSELTVTAGERARRADEIAAVGDHSFRLLIDGRLRPASGGRAFDSIDPFSQRPLARVPDATAEDVDAAADAADRARRDWRRTPARQRARMVEAFADAVEANAEELALLDCLDVGSPISNARNDVRMALDQMRLYAGLALELKGQTIPGAGALHLSVREPEGVVAKIFPFNHPLMFACRVAAPLVAGNTCVIKPPEAGPLSTLRLGELANDIFPAGVLNVIVGIGPAVPDRLVRHRAVRRIGFIGSEATGRSIQRAAAESGVKHVTLELGGKNALVVFDDVDVDQAAAGAVSGMNFTWAGQSCGSTSRLLVHESIHDRVVARVVELVRAIRLGDPLEETTGQGTMVHRGAQQQALGYIRSAIEDGATIVTGGGIPADPELARAAFVEPTVVTGLTPHARLAQEEVFGPVLTVLPFTDEAEAIRIANDVRYGLTGGVWTNDLDRAFRVIGELEAGHTWINGAGPHFPNVPYGGVKASGVGGKEECLAELLSYTEEKVINVMLRQ
ncbi:aldehyde dehydrogenase family protein [Dactylosporangium sp. CA-092794]|uniref:aldehyde dehydrogenase family protein n=1 Tax=Dactylosporangium sp. CA-092794 TaxID=3239929 RepID=UPI003D949523